jgi:hypothetical protein
MIYANKRKKKLNIMKKLLKRNYLHNGIQKKPDKFSIEIDKLTEYEIKIYLKDKDN